MSSTDPCVSGPCENGGTCGEILGQYYCICAVGYVGINCEMPLGKKIWWVVMALCPNLHRAHCSIL